ncbi:MAG: 23S rRNA (adenine(2030)-N(6))-methyltransferase RlmJ [Pseudomonadota bacterium]
MFSYRHGFHAGNHADVLKHTVLVQLLSHLLLKDKPFWVIDTHAGGGVYDLTSTYAAKTGEALDGIANVWKHRNNADLPKGVADLLDQLRKVNTGDRLDWYPGSPQIAAQMLREGDHLRLFELHPTEIKLLQRHFSSVKRGVSIQEADGFAGLKSCVPPPPRRGLIHMDPSYENKDDYRHLIQVLKESVPRFTAGVYAIWYPEVARRESQQLPAQLKRVAKEFGVDWLHATLRVKAAPRGGMGLHGSGMFIINPPHTLYDTMAEALPWLVETIGLDEHAAYSLEVQMR